jgi:hypothetical protein
MAGDPKGTLKPTQTAALLIGSQNLFAAFPWIGMRAGMVTALPLTGSAKIFLLAIGSTPMAHEPLAPAVGTLNRDRDHVIFLLSTDSCALTLPHHSLVAHYRRMVRTVPRGIFSPFSGLCER